MQGDPEIDEFLNEHLTAELTAVNQYFLDARMLQNWGLPGLAKVFRARSMDEMRDAEELIDRILYFAGHPNLQRLDTVRVGETPKEMIELGLRLEIDAIERLRRGVALAVEKGDIGTREMLAHMLSEEEEEHADYFESQLEAIEHVGLQRLGREPTREELAAEVDLPTARLDELDQLGVRPASLDAPVGEHGSTTSLGDLVEDPDAADAPMQEASLGMLRR